MSSDKFPPPHESEIYRGYFEEDIDRVASLKFRSAPAAPGFVVDSFGIKTRVSHAPWLQPLSGHKLDGDPFPGDGIICEGLEYAGAAIAFERATGPTFTTVEIGAGWGPWTAVMAVLAARKNYDRINALAVEASPSRFALLKTHLADNGLLPNADIDEGQMDRIHTRAIMAAAWWRNTTLYFPSQDSADDAGMAAASKNVSVDYRGVNLAHTKVQAIDIAKLCRDFKCIDFMHIDIQGAEWDLIRRRKRFFDSKVHHLLLGTHSRKIEGDVIDLLHNSGWRLFREKPCKFYSMANAPTMTGLTHLDGTQFWENQRIR